MTEAKAKSITPHVHRAVSAIIGALSKEGISKARENKAQGYSFRGIDDVLKALSPLLAANDLVIVPELVERERSERILKNGGVMSFVTVQVRYHFLSSEDGSEIVVGPFPGEGMDMSDKATNKSMSAAYKYMAIQTFCIPTEGEHDADSDTPQMVVEIQPPKPKPAQKEVRASAKKFVDNSLDMLKKAEGSIDAVDAAMEAIRAKPGWANLTDFERSLLHRAKLKVLPPEPDLNSPPEDVPYYGDEQQ